MSTNRTSVRLCPSLSIPSSIYGTPPPPQIPVSCLKHTSLFSLPRKNTPRGEQGWAQTHKSAVVSPNHFGIENKILSDTTIKPFLPAPRPLLVGVVLFDFD
jgi:hypothetical protein